jgi:hypothetical protein
MAIKRMIKESPFPQGEDEIISYRLTTTPWGSSPTAVNVTVFDVTGADETADWDNVTATVMPVNSPAVLGDVITLSPLKLLMDGHIYRIEIRFTCSGNVFETFGLIIGGE